jgi:hypothetical protein
LISGLLELPSNEAVRAAVESGDCATAISDLVVVLSLAAGTLHCVKIDLPKRSFFRFAAQGALCESGGKSLVCLVPNVNENQSRYLSRSLTLAIIPA